MTEQKVNYVMSEAEFLYTKDVLEMHLISLKEGLVERIVNKEVENHNGDYLTEEHFNLIKDSVDKLDALELYKILYNVDYKKDIIKNKSEINKIEIVEKLLKTSKIKSITEDTPDLHNPYQKETTVKFITNINPENN